MKKRNLVLFSVLLILLVLLSSCAGVGPRIGESDIAPVSASTSSTDVSVSSTSSETAVATTSSEATATPVQSADMLSQLAGLLPIVLVFVAFYFFLIRPQKKKEKETVAMRSNIQIGDEITTVGGIIGKVVAIKDQDQFVIETGADKTKIRIARWSIQQKNTISN